jgi:predicted O-methyltransferase YrrM
MSSALNFSDVQSYMLEQLPERPDELSAMEQQARETGFPIIGPVAGNMCYQIARMIGARKVFEMGSGYGYSTAWFARAVHENGGGTVHHVVWDAELSNKARVHLRRLGYAEIVQYHVAEAVKTLGSTPGPFDLIFNDIDKAAYPEALSVIEQRLRPGGMLIVDNMFLGGGIFESSDRSASTAGVRELTSRINASQDWIGSIVPIRDGLLLAYRAP